MPDKQDPRSVIIDERTESISYRGDAYAGRFLMFAVLLYAALRGFLYHESASGWFAIAMAAAAISTLYKMKKKIYDWKRFGLWMLLIVMVGALSGLILVLILRYILALHRHV